MVGRTGVKLFVLLAAPVLCLSTIGPLAAQTNAPCWDISGIWHTQLTLANGLQDFTFTQSGNSVTGKATSGNTGVGTFTGNVTGDHLDIIVTWNYTHPDGSTVEDEYEATISAGTLTGSEHDVNDPSAKDTWTATGGPTKTCAGATVAPSNSTPPTTLEPRVAEFAILQALAASDAPIPAGLSSAGGVAVQTQFESLFPKIDPAASKLVLLAGTLASQDGSAGGPTFPAVRALMPIILRMAYNAVTDPDPAARAASITAGRRLVVILVTRDFAVTKGAPA